jgi:hypothetical protein
MRLFDRIITAIGKPPYTILPQVIFAFVLLSFCYHPQSPLHSWQLPDPDDYSRLVQVQNWLTHPAGLFGGWHDAMMPRLSPDENFIMPWSRLVDLPLAAFASLFACFGMAVTQSLMLAALIVPVILLALLLKLLPAMVRPLLGRDQANLVTLPLLFALPLLFQFTPGRIDHHAWQLLIAAFALTALLRLAEKPYAWRWAVAAGVTFACGLWIGAESLPWLMLFTLCLGLMRLWDVFALERPATIFGGTLLVGSLLVLPLARQSADFGDLSISWFSTAYVAATAAAFLWLAGIEQIASRTQSLRARFTWTTLWGLLLAGGLMALLPQAWQGIYADYHGQVADQLMSNVTEAQPFIWFIKNTGWNFAEISNLITRFGGQLLLPLIGLAYSWLLWRQTVGIRKNAWFYMMLFNAAAVLLTTFWQVRVTTFAHLFALVPVTALLLRGWDILAERSSGRTRYTLEPGWLLALPLVVVSIAALQGNKTVLQAVFFPMMHQPPTCDTRLAAEFLSAPWNYAKPLRLLNDINIGPELMFRTPHSVLSGTYNVQGNLPTAQFFTSTDEAAARKILRDYKIDAVITCKTYSQAYDIRDGLPAPADKLTIIEKLAQGKPPAWLKQVKIPQDDNVLFFEVKMPRNNR